MVSFYYGFCNSICPSGEMAFANLGSNRLLPGRNCLDCTVAPDLSGAAADTKFLIPLHWGSITRRENPPGLLCSSVHSGFHGYSDGRSHDNG